MRKSLSDIVKWDELGFTLSAVFSDGAHVLEYLKDNPTDCLLIDIEMIKVSGLQVAEFIHKNSLPTKIVFLTGHKNFDYAQKAVEYNVEHYILKPVSLPEIKRVFTLMREKLDKNALLEKNIEKQQDSYKRLINYEKEQLITEITMGAFTDRKQLEKRIKMVGINQIELSQSCILLSVHLRDDDSLKDLIKTYGLQEFREYLTKVLRTLDEFIDFYPMEFFGHQMNGIMLEKTKGALFLYRSDPEKFEKDITGLINMSLGLVSNVTFVHYFTDLMKMTEFNYSTEAFLGALDEGLKSILKKQKRLLMTHIIGLDSDQALSLFAVFIVQCHPIGLAGAKNQTIRFFSTVIDKLGNEYNDFQDAVADKISFIEVARLPDEDSLIIWGQQTIIGIIDLLSKMKYQGSDRNVQKIKHFIEENYDRDITLSEIAEQVYLNPFYISKIFKDKTGMTFTDYLTDMRITAAARLLKQPDIYVYEVCTSVGYQNLKHFYKIFKKKTGCTPTEYREKVKLESMDTEI